MLSRLFIIAAALATLANCSFYDFASTSLTEGYPKPYKRPNVYVDSYITQNSDENDGRMYRVDIFEEPKKSAFNSDSFDNGHGFSSAETVRSYAPLSEEEEERRYDHRGSSLEERPALEDDIMYYTDGKGRRHDSRMPREEEQDFYTRKRNFLEMGDTRNKYDQYEPGKPEQEDSRRGDYAGYSEVPKDPYQMMSKTNRMRSKASRGQSKKHRYRKLAADGKQSRGYVSKFKPSEIEQLRYTRDDLYYQKASEDINDMKSGSHYKKARFDKYGNDVDDFMTKMVRPAKESSIFSLVSDMATKGNGEKGYSSNTDRHEVEEEPREGQYGIVRKVQKPSLRDRYSSDFSRDEYDEYEGGRRRSSSSGKRGYDRNNNMEKSRGSSRKNRYIWKVERPDQQEQSSRPVHRDWEESKREREGSYNFLHGDIFEDRSSEREGYRLREKERMLRQSYLRGDRDSRDRSDGYGSRDKTTRSRKYSLSPSGAFSRKRSMVRNDYLVMSRENRPF